MSSGMALIVTGVLLTVQPASPSAPPASPAATAVDRSAYHVVFLTLGPAWVKERGMAQPGIREHGQYMTSLSASGTIVVGGPFLEPSAPVAASGAMVVIATADPAEARKLMEADPGVKSGLFTIGEIRRLLVATGSWRPWDRK